MSPTHSRVMGHRSSRADRFVVISGCSSGGKSTLIAELSERGYAVVDEPGRRIVKEELARGGSALPWVDAAAFARRAIAIALADRVPLGSEDGWVFFDRGLIDAAAALEHMTGEPVLTPLGQANRCHRRVFLAPPWPEIYETDPERRHGLDAALAEYARLLETYPSLGYEVFILPKAGVSERADFVLNTLEAGSFPAAIAWLPTPPNRGSGGMGRPLHRGSGGGMSIRKQICPAYCHRATSRLYQIELSPPR